MCTMEEIDEIARTPNHIPISCYHKCNLDGLLAMIWDMMALVRVYTKRISNKPDFAVGAGTGCYDFTDFYMYAPGGPQGAS
jgi:ribosome-interacting GTPase 1